MRFYSDPAAPLVDVQWYFVPRGTPFIGMSTPFCSRNWELDVGWDANQLGEVFGAPRIWRNGSKVGNAPGTGPPCGHAAAWLNGQVLPPAPPVPVNDLGTPLCCFPSNAAEVIVRATDFDMPRAALKIGRITAGRVPDFELPRALVSAPATIAGRVWDFELPRALVTAGPYYRGKLSDFELPRALVSAGLYYRGKLSDFELPRALVVGKALIAGRVPDFELPRGALIAGLHFTARAPDFELPRAAANFEAVIAGRVPDFELPRAVSSTPHLVTGRVPDFENPVGVYLIHDPTSNLYLPYSMTLRFSAATGGCTAFNGQVTALTWVAGLHQWQGSLSILGGVTVLFYWDGYEYQCVCKAGATVRSQGLMSGTYGSNPLLTANAHDSLCGGNYTETVTRT